MDWTGKDSEQTLALPRTRRFQNATNTTSPDGKN